MYNIEQQSKEWHELRKNRIGSSDAASIMGIGFLTPYKLWRQKIGLDPAPQKTNVMQRGLDLEPKARELFIELVGYNLKPTVVIHKNDWMMASLDGIDEKGENIVEIKCPIKSNDHLIAQQGKVPDRYYPQLQHQLEVCNLDMSYYFSFDGLDGVILKVYRNDAYIKKMVKEEKQFWDCLQDLSPPSLCSKDYQSMNCKEWKEAAEEYVALDNESKKIEKRKDEIKKTLILLSNGQNSQGNGIKITRVVSRGTVDYKDIPELKTIDINKYRKNNIESWRICSS